MSRLPKKTRNSLQKEAIQWENAISEESPEQIQELLNEAEPFKVNRPARQPVFPSTGLPFYWSTALLVYRSTVLPFLLQMREDPIAEDGYLHFYRK